MTPFSSRPVGGPSPTTSSGLRIFSPKITSALSDAYNCNSPTEGVNPPLNWTEAPAGTKGWALLMGSYQKDADGVWVPSGFDWGLYALPANATGVTQNCSNRAVTTCGRAGSAWKQGQAQTEAHEFFYRPPCSSDCQRKNYTFTVFALSQQLTYPAHSLSNYNLSVALTQSGLVLATASMTVSSLRTKGCASPTSSPAAWPSSLTPSPGRPRMR